ncbi:MAG: SIS domain-containing protein [Gammaproteobacteria bacterium]|nr:SIS domain-containing protein [Gammaproteobacteria bacterium]
MQTIMTKEAIEAPQIVANQLQENQKTVSALVTRLRKKPPLFAVTIGRGSSDHACNYAKYLLEICLQLPTASAAPSVSTLYNSELNVDHGLVIGISQSGQSPDICEIMRSARKNKGVTVAIVNDVLSPLAQEAEFVLPMLAGNEAAVAATKSYISSLSALLHLTSTWSQNKILSDALYELPKKLTEAATLDWSSAIPIFKSIQHSFVISRGFGYPIAQEAALKLKEAAVLQAEPFSSAEVLHGPFALVKKDHPFLLFLQNDNSLPSMLEVAQRIKVLGAQTIIAANRDLIDSSLNSIASLLLPLPESINFICDPLMTIQAFYPFASQLALARGYNPDKPDNLKKITETR